MTLSTQQRDDAPAVSILIVAYEARDVIADCLRSIPKSASATSYEILLIDNGTDRTGELVADQFPHVRLIPSQGNIGFGAGNNALARHARGAFLLMLNPDTLLQENAIDNLMAFATKHEEAVAWGGIIRSPDGRPDVSNFLRIPTLEQLLFAALGLERLYTRRHSGKSLDTVRKVEAICGAYFMIGARDFNALGGFDESFFLYSEEMDLFARIRDAGGIAMTTPESSVIHLIGTTGTMSEARALYKARGLMHFARKHWRWPGVFAAAFLIWIAALERSLIGLLKIDRSSRVARMGKVSWAICSKPTKWMMGYPRTTRADNC